MPLRVDEIQTALERGEGVGLALFDGDDDLVRKVDADAGLGDPRIGLDGGFGDLLLDGEDVLAGLDARERKGRLRALLAQRKIHYGSASITIDTDGATVEQLAQRLAQALEQAEEDSVEGEGGS